EEALAVFAAAVLQFTPYERDRVMARTAVVRDSASWARLVLCRTPLILVPSFDESEAGSSAMRRGHRIVVPLGRADGHVESAVDVPRLVAEEAVRALAPDFAPGHARELARLARRSLTAYRRKLAVSPERRRPRWAQPEEAAAIVPLMLVGGWNENVPGDRD